MRWPRGALSLEFHGCSSNFRQHIQFPRSWKYQISVPWTTQMVLKVATRNAWCYWDFRATRSQNAIGRALSCKLLHVFADRDRIFSAFEGSGRCGRPQECPSTMGENSMNVLRTWDEDLSRLDALTTLSVSMHHRDCPHPASRPRLRR